MSRLYKKTSLLAKTIEYAEFYTVKSDYVPAADEIVFTGNIVDDSLWIYDSGTETIRLKNAAELLIDTKAEKVKELRAEGLRLIRLVFPSINDFDELNLVKNQMQSIAPASRQYTPDITTMISIYTAGTDAKAIIEALTDEASVLAYDVVTTPSWP